MKSSSLWLGLLTALVGAALVARVRGPLNDDLRKAHTVDTYALAPPEQMIVLSMGYRAAVADLLLGHVMVSTGIHLQEKRLFEFAPEYIDTINALDPKFRDGYRFSDAIITLQTVKVPVEMYRRARSILERGTRELPFDQELWSSAGQFLAYLAPAHLEDAEERAAWRAQGARFLAKACELLGSNDRIPHHCVTAARLYSEAGNREAARSFLERFLLVTDDPELRAYTQWQLQRLAGDEHSHRAAERAQAFERIWIADLPFVTRIAFAALGPSFDPAACARAAGAVPPPRCATSFRNEATD